MNYTSVQLKLLSIASNLKRIAELVANNKSNINDQLIKNFNDQSLLILDTLEDSFIEKREDLKSLENFLYEIKYCFAINAYGCAEKALVFYNILVNRIDHY